MPAPPTPPQPPMPPQPPAPPPGPVWRLCLDHMTLHPAQMELLRQHLKQVARLKVRPAPPW